MLDKLSAINDRYLEVEKLISSPDAMNDMKSFVQWQWLELGNHQKVCLQKVH